MTRDEGYEGFVPITVILPDRCIKGRAWKDAGRRLLDHIEQRKRRFLPIVDAEATGLTGEEPTPKKLPIIAVNTAAIISIIPGDTVTPVVKKTSPRRVAEKV